MRLGIRVCTEFWIRNSRPLIQYYEMYNIMKHMRLNAVDCSQNISSSNKAFTLVWRQKVHIFKLFQPVFVLIFIQTFSRSGKHFLSFENFSNNLRPYNLSPFHLKLKTGPSQSQGMLKKRSRPRHFSYIYPQGFGNSETSYLQCLVTSITVSAENPLITSKGLFTDYPCSQWTNVL